MTIGFGAYYTMVTEAARWQQVAGHMPEANYSPTTLRTQLVPEVCCIGNFAEARLHAHPPAHAERSLGLFYNVEGPSFCYFVAASYSVLCGCWSVNSAVASDLSSMQLHARIHFYPKPINPKL